MKKDRKTAEFIRDKLTNLICTEYNRYEATKDDHLILVNAIHDIYKLYTPDTMEHLQEYLTNVIDNRHVMVNYPPKDNEFIRLKNNNEITLLEIINEKLNSKEYEVYILPEVSFISVPLVEQYKFILKYNDNNDGLSYFTTYLSIGTHLVEYFKYRDFYDIHQKVVEKCVSIIDGNKPSANIQEKLETVPLHKNDVIKSILNSINSRNNSVNLFFLQTESWVYNKNKIEDDDKYYIFRLETNQYYDNDKFTTITTWRNVVHEGYKFIAFQECPSKPNIDYVQPKEFKNDK